MNLFEHFFEVLSLYLEARISIKVTNRIRIRIIVMRICTGVTSIKFLYKSQEAQSGAVGGPGCLQWRRKGSAWSPGGPVDLWSPIHIILMRSRIRIRIKVKRWILIRIKVKGIRSPGHQDRTGTQVVISLLRICHDDYFGYGSMDA